MKLDEEDLKIMHDIANRRELLSRRGSAAIGTGRPMRDLMKRRLELQQQEDALIIRFLNKGLRAAGLDSAIDPATVALPVCAQENGRKFCPPDPVLLSECEAKRIAGNLATTPGNVRVLFASTPRPAPERPSVKHVEIPEAHK